MHAHVLCGLFHTMLLSMAQGNGFRLAGRQAVLDELRHFSYLFHLYWQIRRGFLFGGICGQFGIDAHGIPISSFPAVNVGNIVDFSKVEFSDMPIWQYYFLLYGQMDIYLLLARMMVNPQM